MKTANDQKIFLILSGALDENSLSLLRDVSQLDSIYILCPVMANEEQLFKGQKRVKGLFSDISLICDRVQRNIRQYEPNWTPISTVSASHTADLNQISPSFMYSQLLKNILLGMPYDERAKQEFVDSLDGASAQEFQRNYENHSPIWWYTKESFMYSEVNKALRTQDIDIIIRMGFFIRDLHRQIEQFHSATHQPTKMVVYRGQGMTEADFEMIKKNPNGLLTFENFLSTSTDQQLSGAGQSNVSR